jgi:cytochrome c oxidase cbb3-type subunit III
MKKLFALTFLIAGTSSGFAQDAQIKSFLSDPVNHPMTPAYALMALLLIVVLIIAIVGIAMIRVLNSLADKAERERAERTGVPFKPRPSFWSRFVQKANASVALEDEKSIEMDHDYDGIRELDNHLPPWWKWLFYGTIGWAGVYMIVYHFSGSLPLMEDEYKNEVSIAEDQKKQFLAKQPKVEVDESTLEYTHDEAIISKGKEIYSINCSPCHKNDGGGGIGPNLTDEYWLHGGDVKNIYTVVKNGVPEKGMISWAGVLKPEELRNVSFFIMSLKGTNPPGAKGPQGEVFKAGTADVKSDSSNVQASL